MAAVLPQPALLIKKSIAPHSFSVCLTSRSSSSSRVTSVGRTSASPSRPRISSATARSSASLRAASATRAPAWLSARAIARPMPRPAPVTMATFPDRDFIFWNSFLFGLTRNYLFMRLRRHENQQDEPVRPGILDPVLLARRRHGDLPRAELPVLAADLKPPFAFDDVIDFIRAVVRVRRLALARLEAVEIAEKPVGFEEAVLFHLVGREPGRVGQLLEIRHISLLDRLCLSYRAAALQIKVESAIV